MAGGSGGGGGWEFRDRLKFIIYESMEARSRTERHLRGSKRFANVRKWIRMGSMSRPDDAAGKPSASRCFSPAGASPASVSAGAPSSRPQARPETAVARAGCRKPLRREQVRGPQHEVEPAETGRLQLHRYHVRGRPARQAGAVLGQPARRRPRAVQALPPGEWPWWPPSGNDRYDQSGHNAEHSWVGGAAATTVGKK